MSFDFSKYSGLGNDFIFVDNRRQSFPIESTFIQNICNRHDGIGADGVVLLENSREADHKMRIFNSDGHEAEMCGNALRCFYLFLKELGFERSSFQVETYDRVLRIAQEQNEISCEMGEVSSIEWDIDLTFNEMLLKGHFIHTGVPHVVIPTTQLNQLPILPLGRFVRMHPHFQPHGTNVNFISLNKDQTVQIRTYERGVELETQACGTGGAASAIIAHLLYQIPTPISIKTIQGNILTYDFLYKNGIVEGFKMKGPAAYVFKGTMPLKHFENSSLLASFGSTEQI
jgi:diaminopimelate epimerase